MAEVIKDIRSLTKKFRSVTTVPSHKQQQQQQQVQNDVKEDGFDEDFATLRNNVTSMLKANPSWKNEWFTGDSMLIRYLNAFGNASEATEKISQYFQWRYNEGIDDVDPEDPVLAEILAEQGNVVLDEVYDLKGRPILVITPRRHQKNMYTEEQVFRSAVYCLEKISKKCDESQSSGFCMIYNLEGFTKANMDLSFAQRYFKCLKDYYPERIGLGLIINYPPIVHPFWKVIKMWMNPRMRNKFVFCSKKQFKDYVDVDELPVKLFAD